MMAKMKMKKSVERMEYKLRKTSQKQQEKEKDYK